MRFKVIYESVRPSPFDTVDLMPSVVIVKANSLDEASALVLYYFPPRKSSTPKACSNSKGA